MVRLPLATSRRRIPQAILLVGATVLVVSDPASAQTLCESVVSDIVNEIAPLLVTLTIAGGVFIGTIMHGIAGMFSDPDQVRFYKKWRNRAISGALGVFVLAYFLDTALGTVYPGWNSCITLFPFGLGA